MPLTRSVTPRRNRRDLVAILLTLIVLVTAIGGTGVVMGADDLTEAQAEQEALKAKIESQKQAIADMKKAEAELKGAISRTESALTDVNADQDQVKAEIASATAALEIVEQRYKELVAELKHLDWTLGLLEAEVEQTKQDLEERKRVLADRLAEAYRTGQTSLLEQIISAESFADVLADVGSHLRFSDQDAQLAAQIEVEEANLQALQRSTTATRFRTEQVRQEVARQAAQIREQRARLVKAKAALDKLEKEMEAIQAAQLKQFEQLVETQEQAEELLRDQVAAQTKLAEDIERIIAERTASGAIPSEYSGSLIWPMEGRVSQTYGCTGFAWEPPYGDCAHFHKGIDLVAPMGTEVVAAGDGVVAFIGYNPYDSPDDPAWIVIIAHSETLQTWYGHLEPRFPEGIESGAEVKSGQVIGYEGNTGKSTGAHLHWAVVLGDAWVNPRLFI
jgi:murein DD-endopeptidase MepM/ murein hydrolase activator NlpD